MPVPRLLPAAALLVSACAADPQAASASPPVAVAAVSQNDATAGTAVCTVEPFLSGYRTVVAWQRTPTTTVSLRAEGAASDQQLAKRTRTGGLTVQLGFIPTNVVLLARTKVT